jgi:hypothetical protein
MRVAKGVRTKSGVFPEARLGNVILTKVNEKTCT